MGHMMSMSFSAFTPFFIGIARGRCATGPHSIPNREIHGNYLFTELPCKPLKGYYRDTYLPSKKG